MTAAVEFEAALDADAAGRRAAAVEASVLRTRLRPPPRLTVSEWADRYRHLSPEACARPGPFSTDDAPYQREPMDVCGDPRYPRVVLMWGSQVGKTEIVNNVVGYHIDQDPAPILVMQPTLDMAEAWSKDRLAPMLRDTPRLRDKVAGARTRDSGNTLLHKSYPGGHVTIVGANSAAGLASRPIRIVPMDEIDRYPASAGAEGDPTAIAESRTATFPNPKLIKISSPTIKGRSPIAAEFEKSDRRRYWVPCPHCQHEQVLEFGGKDVPHGLKWDLEGDDVVRAFYVCVACRAQIDEFDKGRMLKRGRWIPDNPDSRTPGFWINALYSPFFSWARLAARWLRDKGDPLKLQGFVNTMLCELWDPIEGDAIDPDAIGARREAYCDEHGEVCDVPAGAAVLTRSVDTQGDRLETAVWAWGAGEECWLVSHEMLSGDPSLPESHPDSPWRALATEMKRKFRHASGAELAPAVTFVDSGGHHTKEVYAFTRARVAQKVFAIKGSSMEGAPLLGRPSRSNSAKAVLYMVGSFTGKESVMARLARILEPGPGYTHLPDWLDDEQVAQLTNEQLVPKIVGGRLKRTWRKTGRNEMLDLAVYGLAALHVLGPATMRNLGAMAARLSEQTRAAAADPADVASPPSRAPQRRGSWAQRWRG